MHIVTIRNHSQQKVFHHSWWLQHWPLMLNLCCGEWDCAMVPAWFTIHMLREGGLLMMGNWTAIRLRDFPLGWTKRTAGGYDDMTSFQQQLPQLIRLRSKAMEKDCVKKNMHLMRHSLQTNLLEITGSFTTQLVLEIPGTDVRTDLLPFPRRSYRRKPFICPRWSQKAPGQQSHCLVCLSRFFM